MGHAADSKRVGAWKQNEFYSVSSELEVCGFNIGGLATTLRSLSTSDQETL